MCLNPFLQLSLNLRKLPDSLIAISNLAYQILVPHLEFQFIALDLYCLALTLHARLLRFELLHLFDQLHTPIDFLLVLMLQKVRFLRFEFINLVGSTAFFTLQILLHGLMSLVVYIFFYFRDHFRMDFVVFFKIFLLILIRVIFIAQSVVAHLRTVYFLE